MDIFNKNNFGKKGFTLIELLAVIVILAIVMVVTIPSVLNSMSSAKSSQLDNASKGLSDWLTKQYNISSFGDDMLEVDPVYTSFTEAYGEYEGTYDSAKALSSCEIESNEMLSAAGISEPEVNIDLENSYVWKNDNKIEVKLTAKENGSFYVNGGTNISYSNSDTSSYSEFKIYGNSIQNGTPSPSNPVEIKSVGDNVTGLPLGYTQLKYIESTSTGTYGINTNILAIGKKIEIEAEYTGTTNDLNILLTYSQDYFGTFVGTYNKNWAISTSEVSSSSASQKTKLVVTFTSENNLNKVNMTVNNETFEKTSGRPNNYILLFGYEVGSALTLSNKFIGKIYSCKIYNNNTNELVFNGIPCKNSSNVIGMYDTVNNVFYTNAGTGTFVAGNEVEKGGYKIPITVSDGTNSSTTNIYLDEPLRKIGDYADYIDFKNGKVVRKVKAKKIDSVTSYNDSTKYFTEYFSDMVSKNVDNSRQLILSSHYAYDTRTWSNKNLEYGFVVNNKNLEVRNLDYNSTTDFNNYLSAHPFVVNYALSTSTEQTISLPNITSLNETTTCSVGTEVQPSNVVINY